MKIIVDSGCDMTEEVKNNINTEIETIPLTLQIGEKQFVDDHELDVNKYVLEMEQSEATPRTAAPSPELYLEKYKDAASAFVITISSHLSASYNNAVLAKKMYLEEAGHKFIHVFNSLSASVGQTIIAMKINEFLKDKVSNVEIIEKIDKFIDGMQTYFILENYNNLVKNGRINPYIAKIGQFLSIKPICYAKKGKTAMLDKAKGYDRAVDKLIKIIEKSAVNFEERVLAIAHVQCVKRAVEFKEKITAKLKFKDVIIVNTSGLCSTYAERDGLIISL